MVSLFSHSTAVHNPPHHLLSFTINHLHHRPPNHFKPHRPHRRPNLSLHSSETNNNVPSTSNTQPPPQRTLFPGGFKRREIKVPNLVLLLNPEDVLDDKLVLDAIDDAVSGQVGIVVLNCGQGNGRMLYDAACLLKPVIRDRAYLLIADRVDIAAAVNASGVLVSDQGLPAIVARNTMMESSSESVFLPMVARYVQTSNAAMSASSFEGADFLIYGFEGDKSPQELTSSVLANVKIPTFVAVDLLAEEKLFSEISDLLRLGASGLAVSLKGLQLLSIDFLKNSYGVYGSTRGTQEKQQSLDRFRVLDVDNGVPGENGMSGFVDLVERERQLIRRERSMLLEAINVIRRAAPLMEEVSLLSDAVAQLSEPFLLVIVGEFNSGKSTFINALLGQKYLNDGVIPTTNEITFLRYSESVDEQQRCERLPDGQYLCYLPAPILKNMIIVDTPGTNVILQRQQRLTEEFVPRADLLLFVISADRPLTESEVAFLRYTQQWKKKVVFVLNKSDIYLNASELEEAIAFIKENTQKLLNTEEVILFPVSARTALEEKLSASSEVGIGDGILDGNNSHWKSSRFRELEEFLYSFLDSSSSTGMERMKLKLETPIVIAEQLLSASQKLVGQEFQQAKEDLTSIDDLVNSVKKHVLKMENDSISWKRQSLSLIDNAQARVVKLIESTLRLSNLDLAVSYTFRGGKTDSSPAAASVQIDIIGPALMEAQKLSRDYSAWLQLNIAREARFYRESFERRRPSFVDPQQQIHFETHELEERKCEISAKVVEDFSAAAASKLFEQEIREVFLGTFGGLGAAGLSASLLTSILPTTLEDLLALGLCSAGGYIAIANFPARRQKVTEKVKRTADALARELEEGMQKDLLEMTANLENFVRLIGKPYQDFAQSRLDKLLATQEELSIMEEKLRALYIEIQNLHRL